VEAAKIAGYNNELPPNDLALPAIQHSIGAGKATVYRLLCTAQTN
jgi:hypothetical protein